MDDKVSFFCTDWTEVPGVWHASRHTLPTTFAIDGCLEDESHFARRFAVDRRNLIFVEVE